MILCVLWNTMENPRADVSSCHLGWERGMAECHELFQIKWPNREEKIVFEQNSEQKDPAMQKTEDRYPS